MFGFGTRSRCSLFCDANVVALVSVQAVADADPLIVVEVLLHCSKDSVKDAATEAATPAGPGETGEMQVGSP